MGKRLVLTKEILPCASLRFFQTSPIRFSDFPPHSKKYVEDQLQELIKRETPAQRVHLKKGKKLVGLNIFFTRETVHGGAPLYDRDTLPKLSAKELERFLYMDANYVVRVLDFEVHEDIECAATKTESGDFVYYVHMAKLAADANTMQRVSDALKPSSTSSLTKK